MQVTYKRKKAWLRERAEGVVNNEKTTRRYTKTWVREVHRPSRRSIGELFQSLCKEEGCLYRRSHARNTDRLETEE